MRLSSHFNVEEFSKDAPIPEECLPVLTRLCLEILEPIRVKFLTALLVTSGYRPPEQNAEAHGIPNSEHIYSEHWCAADFLVCNDQLSPRKVFDWLRLNPFLPYHQLILEHSEISSIIHVSLNTLAPGVRSVKEGATHNSARYINVEHAAFEPPSNAVDVQNVLASD